jgi:RNA polymerase subunit RPABC4/transcription elongation factor Spt4
MEPDKSEYQCSDCGAAISSEAKSCPNCGALLVDPSEEIEYGGILIPSDPAIISAIQSALEENDIQYSIADSSMDTVFGLSISQMPRLIVNKNQIEQVKEIVEAVEKETVQSFAEDELNNEDYEIAKEQFPEVEEDDDEKLPLKGVRGWLLFFCISLVFINPLLNIPLTILYIVNQHNTLTIFPLLNITLIIDLVITSLFSLIGIYIGIKLWRIQSRAIPNANLYLNLLLIYSIIAFVAYLISIASNDVSFNSKSVKFLGDNFRSTVYSIGYVIAWKLYLKNSERVKNTFGLGVSSIIQQ